MKLKDKKDKKISLRISEKNHDILKENNIILQDLFDANLLKTLRKIRKINKNKK